MNCRAGHCVGCICPRGPGESYDLEPLVTTTDIVTVFHFVTKDAYFASPSIAIDLGEIAMTLCQGRRPGVLPSSLAAIVSEIGGHSMGMELRI